MDVILKAKPFRIHVDLSAK